MSFIKVGTVIQEIVIQENWILQYTAFLANFKRLRQTQTRTSSTGAGNNRPGPALNGTYQLRPAATGYNRHNTGPDYKILYLYQHLRKYREHSLLRMSFIRINRY